MTVQETIKAIRLDGLSVEGGVRRIQKFTEGLAEATELLEEVEQYRALGTVEELKEAREKQTPKKPINNECPICEEPIPRWDTRYCPDCGQALKWGEEDD